MAKVSTRLQATSALAGVALAAFGAMGDAEAGGGKTISQVASMPGNQSTQYVYDHVYSRSLEVGQRLGDTPAQCLRTEFVTITKSTDGKSVILPRGLNVAVDTVLGFNAAGRGHYGADAVIDKVFEMRAQKVCGVQPGTIDTAQLSQ